MTEYDSYVLKLQKLSKHIPLIKKAIILIISVIILGIIYGLFIFIRTGTFTTNISCDSIIYGEKLVYDSKAFNADVQYYFSEYNLDEWFQTPPYRAGKYNIKAVAKTLWNSTNESLCSFEINKRDLNVNYTCSSIEYGFEPALSIDYSNLANGDTVIKADYKYNLPDGLGKGTFFKLENGDVSIVNKYGENVSDCYNIISSDEHFDVTAKSLCIEPKAESFEYDSLEHYCTDYVVTDSEFDKELHVNISGSAITPGIIETYIDTYDIFDKNGKNITDCYDVKTNTGTLEIRKRSITITVENTDKYYDGKPIETVTYEIVDGSLIDGDVLKASLRTKPVDVGGGVFHAEFKILRHEEDVSDYYDIHVNNGYYRIRQVNVEKPSLNNYTVNNDNNTDSENIVWTSEEYDDSYDISSKNINGFDNKILKKSEELSNDKSEPLFMVKSDESTTLLLRSISMGDYDGKGKWLDAPIFTSPYSIKPLNLAPRFLLRGFKNTKHTIDISSLDNEIFDSTLVPYFSFLYDFYDSDNQVVFSGKHTYSFNTMFSDLDTFLSLQNILSEDTMFSVSYYQYNDFVHNNYLSIDPYTAMVLREEVMASQEYKDNKDIIHGIADYVRNVAVYNLNFVDYPDDVDPIEYFLSTAHEGVCQHYASAATLIYRAFGIPARYTMGYAVSCQKNQWTRVYSDNAHSWVEIYLDDVGWIPIDVTGTSPIDYLREHEPLPEQIERGSLIIEMLPAIKTFDNEPFSSNEYKLFYGSLVNGDRLFVTGTANETYVGSYENSCNYYILDKDDQDVTNEYSIQVRPGNLRIEPIQLIHPGSIEIQEKLEEFDLADLSWNQSKLNIIPTFKHHTFSPIDYCISLDGSKIKGLSTGVTNLKAEYQAVDYNNDGINEIKYSQINEIKVSVTAFSNVNIREGNFDESNNIISNDYIIKEDIFGNKYNCLFVKMASCEKSYDGYYLYSDDVELISGKLYDGDTITAIGKGSRQYTGSAPNLCASLKVINNKGEDVTSNYYINVYSGTLTVNPVTIEFEDANDIGLWSSHNIVSFISKELLKYPDLTTMVTDGFNLISQKNDAITAILPGKLSVQGYASYDANNDGLPEQEFINNVNITIKITYIEWGILGLIFVILFSSIIKFSVKSKR